MRKGNERRAFSKTASQKAKDRNNCNRDKETKGKERVNHVESVQVKEKEGKHHYWSFPLSNSLSKLHNALPSLCPGFIFLLPPCFSSLTLNFFSPPAGSPSLWRASQR